MEDFNHSIHQNYEFKSTEKKKVEGSWVGINKYLLPYPGHSIKKIHLLSSVLKFHLLSFKMHLLPLCLFKNSFDFSFFFFCKFKNINCVIIQ